MTTRAPAKTHKCPEIGRRQVAAGAVKLERLAALWPITARGALF